MRFREFREKVKKLPFFGSDVAGILSVSLQAMRNQLSRWKKQGLLIELKRGLYALGEGERRTMLTREAASANIYQPSYISIESALSFYKMIPERVAAVTAVTIRKTRTFRNREGTFIYRHLKPSPYFGYAVKKDDEGFPYFIATPEKALLDYLYLNLGGINSGDKRYFTDSLRLQNRAVLNKRKLLSFAQRFNIRKLNLILENLK